MNLIHPRSLAGTLANLNEALLRGEKLTAAQRDETATWIAGRVGVPGSYRGLPAPMPRDYHTKLKLFTGETVGSHAGTGCKLGFEATWALQVLRPRQALVRAAAETCRQRAIERFAGESRRRTGMYCCYSCSVAGWRALGASAAPEARKLLKAGIARLQSARDGKGYWKGFPFWYTVLALNGLDEPAAREELRYAAHRLKRACQVAPGRDTYRQRRRLLAESALGRSGV